MIVTLKSLLRYSIKHNLKHIPSALSQYSYLKDILPLLKNFKIVIGKPFGSQAYYCIWEKMYNLPKNLSYGIKHEELDFVEYGEETIGNALGIASGIAMCQNRSVYCNISDGCFQMGPVQEAIQFIGKHQQKILLTIDCNEFQLTGNTNDIIGLTAEKIEQHFNIYGWDAQIIDTSKDFNIDINRINYPSVIIFKTKKGQGVKEMENNPLKWHYRELKDINEITII